MLAAVLSEPFGIVTCLVIIEAFVLLAADYKPLERLFRYVPSMFWIYFLPMVANTLGLFPPDKAVVAGPNGPVEQVVTPAYDIITSCCLPASLVLLLLSVDLRSIFRLGKYALAIMLVGSIGTFIGAPIVLMAFGGGLPPEAWKGFGALSASWVGGSANMIAVAKGLETPDNVIKPMMVVDTIVPYAWMALLIILSSYQVKIDKWNRCRAGVIDEIIHRARTAEQTPRPVTLPAVAGIFAVAGGVAWLASLAGAVLPKVPNMVTAGTWMYVLATTAGLGLSFTPAKRLEAYGASRVGYMLLYFVLAAIGARTSLSSFASTPLLLVAGVIWVCIHGLTMLLVGGRLMRAPMSLLASASQANIGGTASAPVVAGIYHPSLAPVGLLLAVLGNIIGTYTGFACAHVCRWVMGN